MRLGKSALCCALLSSTAPIAAWGSDRPDAATAPGPAAAETNASEIIVTARRREEQLSKVPITVTAISQEHLAAQSIMHESDLQAAVPGLIIKQNGGSNTFNYVIRGQTIDA